jgi:hypothetical protein
LSLPLRWGGGVSVLRSQFSVGETPHRRRRLRTEN